MPIEGRFEALLEAAPDGILVVDEGGRITLMNAQAEAMFGYERSELLGERIERLVPERFHGGHVADRERYSSEPRRRPMGGGLDLAARHRDGSELPVAISLSPVEVNGQRWVITIVRDVRERVAAEGRFRGLMESAPDAIVLVNAQGRIVLANRRTAELFGYAVDELVEAPIELLVPDHPRAQDVEQRPGYHSDPHAGPPAPLDLTGRRKDGRELPVELSFSPLSMGDETLVTTIIRDVSERRAAEAERLELVRAQAAPDEAEAATARLREILGDLDAIVWESENADRRTLSFVSGRAQALLGYSPQDWVEREGFWVDMIHPEDRDRVVNTSLQEVARGRDHELEYRVLAADGRIVWLRDLVHLSGGRLRGVIVDVTERQELEARLLQSQKMDAVGQLAGGVAHDFNNLLTVISGYAELLNVQLEGERAREALSEIQGAASRAQALTRQLLTFSRRGAQAAELVDVNELIARLEPMLRRLIDEDIDFAVELSSGAQLVQIDPNQLEQAVINLVVNARDAMPSGGALRVLTRTRDLGGRRHLLLRVSDTGHGMDEQTRARAFEPFFTTKPAGKGTGLGLATAYAIIDRAGGRIEIESEPGRGTETVILLPVAVAPDVASGGDDDRPTILVAEDEPALRRLVELVLEREGHRVLTAANGREALELADREHGRIDLLLTDIVMPELNGPTLVARLAERIPTVRVLYMSGYSDSRLAGRGFDEHTVDLLQKPFSPEQLAERVKQSLSGSPGTARHPLEGAERRR